MTLFEFHTEKSVRSWYAQNDVVMGGVSTGGFVHVPPGAGGAGAGRFHGEVSLENNGGFAQVRCDAASFDLTGFDGIELQVKGDGRRYQLRLRTDAERVAYAHPFRAGDAWQRIRLPFRGFEPTFRGRRVPDAPSLDPAAIRAVGFLIGDGQQGGFALEIRAVTAYRE